MDTPWVWDYSVLMFLIPFPSAQPGSRPPSAPTGGEGETSLTQRAEENSAKLLCQAMGTCSGWVQDQVEPPHACEQNSSPAQLLSPGSV